MYILIEAFSAAIFLISLFLLLWRVRFHDFWKTLRYLVFAVYVSAVYHLVGLPTIQFLRFDVTLNLIPFAGLAADFKNAVLNVALFVPLGILLPFLWKDYRTFKRTVFFGFGMSLSIELLQMLTFRATDVNDLLTNTLGAAIGYWIYKIAVKLVPALGNAGRRKNDAGFLILIVCAVMFFLQPVIASFLYRIT